MLDTNFNDYTKSKNVLQDKIVDYQQTQDPAKLQDIFKDLDETINTGVYSFAGGDESLKTRAYIIAKKAIENYDADRNTNPKTHIYNNLKGLYRYKADRGAPVRVPENIRFDNLAVEDAKNELYDKLGREPNITELQDFTGLSKKRLVKAQQVSAHAPQAQFMTEKGDVGLSPKSYDDAWIDYVYHDMDDINKKIFEYKTGYGGSEILNNKDIAKKLNKTPALVSIRLDKIKEMLQQGA